MMRMRKNELFLAAVCVFLLIVSASAQTPSKPVAKTAVDEQWQTYELGKGTFAVMLPGKPTEDFKPAKGANDSDIYLYTLETKDGYINSNYTNLPEAAEKWPKDKDVSFYVGFWEGFVSATNEELKRVNAPITLKLESQRAVTFAGRDGYEFVFSAGTGRGHLLITRIGRKAFSAMMLVDAAAVAEYEEKFIGSFKIKASPPDPV